jgi:hypothetical protein
MPEFRSLDVILFGLIVCILAWQAIQYAELDSLRYRLIRAIEFREVP